MNGRTGQITGALKANQELMEIIKSVAAGEVLYVHHLGIQTSPKTEISLNNKDILIGDTGIYEIDNAEINSIYFKNDLDCILASVGKER